jgi:hypothetical protein
LTIHPTTEKTHADLVEFNTHSFVIKIWIEGTPNGEKKPSWRGHITHIPSGERRYVTTLYCVFIFIMRYLKSMGIKFGRFWWIKDWSNSRIFRKDQFEAEANITTSSPQTTQIKSKG